ncbi:MAG: hypothetical protein KME31_32645 [Tolypothrix carrinoi HA7290-LM1]|nr:hypothetical protein [Tolypothrix carrinoi HA7290-LM1]
MGGWGDGGMGRGGERRIILLVSKESPCLHSPTPPLPHSPTPPNNQDMCLNMGDR